MAECEVCGNYDGSFELLVEGERHVFGSFECAIHALAPQYARCGLRIVGHGVEADGSFYCGAHCAHQSGVGEAQDRV